LISRSQESRSGSTAFRLTVEVSWPESGGKDADLPRKEQRMFGECWEQPGGGESGGDEGGNGGGDGGGGDEEGGSSAS
jgi:hypothetical protein